MRKIAIAVESHGQAMMCLVHLPEEFADNQSNAPVIQAELSKAFEGMGFGVMSMQRMIECGLEL